MITLSSIRTTIDLILKGFRMASTVITIDDDSDSDTLDSLRLIKDYVKVKNKKQFAKLILKVYSYISCIRQNTSFKGVLLV